MAESSNNAYAKLGMIIEKFLFEVVYAPEGYEKVRVTVADTYRPGLPLAGYMDYFDNKRMLVFGLAEHKYMQELPSEVRYQRLEAMISQHIPAIVICRDLEVPDEMLDLAKKYQTTILRTDMETSELVSTLVASLKVYLSPCITRHGVLMEIYGEGVLILGDSGIGKSETAVELVNRGHRLVADDAVEIKKMTAKVLIGSAPELIRHYMELRGIGVVDICRLFGMSAVVKEHEIDMVVKLELWKDGFAYDRLGLTNEFTEILGIQVPTVTIPVKPGRNLAVIVEVAAMSNRDKRSGYNAAEEFTKQLNSRFEQQGLKF
ncbi:MAG: HPr(Ser) kinase/phosphatase [Oscillospiraceae bacterium]|nr:HPr(Ser) kinase/phosphatase [Oscillospiraceae bacterium]